ncbi:hypothetical protein [Denitromonas sp.]|uniref:hypothetical protein n=1 Tax=Denitromonas sp. TaxID=2734609 RepID=UPI003A865401
MGLKNGVQLIVYPDRTGRDLADLETFLDGPVGDAIAGLHLLPRSRRTPMAASRR